MKNKAKTKKKKEEPQSEEDKEKSKLVLESQNMANTITKKNIEISYLKKKLKENMQYISSMQSEVFTLKKFYSDSSKVKRELDDANEKNQKMEKEIEALNKKILEQHEEFTEWKRIEEKKHLAEVTKLRVTIDSYIQKSLRSNMNELDNEKLYLQLNELKKENKDIVERTKQQMIQKDIENKIKFTKLKDKMLENINETKEEVTELNMKYMDISTKLTLLQNHQLLGRSPTRILPSTAPLPSSPRMKPNGDTFFTISLPSYSQELDPVPKMHTMPGSCPAKARAAPTMSEQTSTRASSLTCIIKALARMGDFSGVHPAPKKWMASILDPLGILGTKALESSYSISLSVSKNGLIPLVLTRFMMVLPSIRHQSVLVDPLSAISLIFNYEL
mgnify:CR=1 FL=1